MHVTDQGKRQATSGAMFKSGKKEAADWKRRPLNQCMGLRSLSRRHVSFIERVLVYTQTMDSLFRIQILTFACRFNSSEVRVSPTNLTLTLP